MRLKTLENQMRVYMSPSNYQTMLDCADSRRAHLTMRLMGEAGLRIGEVDEEVKMERLRESSHPDVDIWFLKLYGKDTKDRDTDGKRRDVWISQSLKEEMDSYQEAEGRSDDVPLLLASKRTLQNDIEATREHAVERTGNEDFGWISCHDFRAYFATNMLIRERVDVETVMELGGWEDRQSMDPYINASFDDIIQDNLASAGVLEQDVDTTDSVGDTTGSWVLAGPTVDSMRPHLQDLNENLDLQDGADGFSAFRLDLNIVDGDRREAVATALSRQLSLKSLKPTRETVSILHALTSDIFAAARTVSCLGAESDQPRNLTTEDICYRLSMLDVDELLPDIGPQSVSEAVAILLDVEEPISTGELADFLNVSMQTLRNNETHFADLEAAGVIDREDLGAGRATEWRICLPFDGEKTDSRTATPTPDVDTTAYGPQFSENMAVIAEVLYKLGHCNIDYGCELTLAVTGSGDRLDEWLDQHSSVRPVLSLVTDLKGTTLEALTDGTDSMRDQPPKSVILGLDPAPETTQTSLVASAN